MGTDCGLQRYLFLSLPLATLPVASHLMFSGTPAPVDVTQGFLKWICAASALGSALLIGVILFSQLPRGKSRFQLEEEHRRPEILLLNILPAPVADRLKIAGLTSLSASMGAVHLLELLNDIFSRFNKDGHCRSVARLPWKSAGNSNFSIQMPGAIFPC